MGWRGGLLTRLTPVLHQGIVGIRLAQGQEVLVIQVEVIDATDESVDALALEGGGQGAHEGSLAGALDAVETDDKGPGGRVLGQVLEYEGNANGGLIVYELVRHGRLEGG